MISTFIIQRFFLFAFIYLSKYSQSKVHIVLTFNNNLDSNYEDNVSYCDDEINNYGTSNLMVYEINENNEKININSKLKLIKLKKDIIHLECLNNVIYKPNSN